jgi:hypothetical protein
MTNWKSMKRSQERQPRLAAIEEQPAHTARALSWCRCVAKLRSHGGNAHTPINQGGTFPFGRQYGAPHSRGSKSRGGTAFR